MESEKIYAYGVGITMSQIDELAITRRETNSQVISKLLKNKSNWIESEKASLFWDGRGWSVNKMVEDEEDFIIHEFLEDELDKAIEQFEEHTLDDQLSRTDEEVIYAKNMSNNRKRDEL